MPLRWYITPVWELQVNGTLYRRPWIATLLDPSRPGKEYHHTSIVRNGINWCLTKVQDSDFSVIDADANCINLLESNFEEDDGFIESTVRDLGWTAAKRNRVLNRLEAKGVDTSSYTLDTPLWRIVLDLARVIWPDLTRERLKAGMRLKLGAI